MKVKDLKTMLNHSDRHDDDDLMIKTDSPSVGPVSMHPVKSTVFGFDWEKGKVILYPEGRLVEKSEKEDIWDMASDLLYFLATERGRTGKLKNSWANNSARRIREKAGIKPSPRLAGGSSET